MKMIFVGLLLVACFLGCKDYNIRNNENEKEKKQVETIEAGLLMMSDEALSSEQKELKEKIYQVLLEGVQVDTVANHLQLVLTEKDFKQRGLDEKLYQKCLDEIDDVNAYADETGRGKEMMKSWIESKENYLKRSVGK